MGHRQLELVQLLVELCSSLLLPDGVPASGFGFNVHRVQQRLHGALGRGLGSDLGIMGGGRGMGLSRRSGLLHFTWLLPPGHQKASEDAFPGA